MGAGHGTGQRAQLPRVLAPDTAAAEIPRVRNLFPALEMTLEHVGVADGQLCTSGDGDLGLQHSTHVQLGQLARVIRGQS